MIDITDALCENTYLYLSVASYIFLDPDVWSRYTIIVVHVFYAPPSIIEQQRDPSCYQKIINKKDILSFRILSKHSL